mgnify:CR=1 FL=1
MKATFICSICLFFAVFLGNAYASVVAENNQDLLTVGENYTSTVNGTALDQALAGVPSGELSDAEKEDLLYMAEEEKLAGDVYSALNEKWNLRVFDNIIRAERTHEAAVKTLLTRYSLSDPTKGLGKFSNESLQGLYDSLVARGSASVEQALMVGAAVEEIDILDLDRSMAKTDREDILLVYSNLRRGSENHLRAFANNLERQGVQYSPQYLSSEAYGQIANQ